MVSDSLQDQVWFWSSVVQLCTLIGFSGNSATGLQFLQQFDHDQSASEVSDNDIHA